MILSKKILLYLLFGGGMFYAATNLPTYIDLVRKEVDQGGTYPLTYNQLMSSPVRVGFGSNGVTKHCGMSDLKISWLPL